MALGSRRPKGNDDLVAGFSAKAPAHLSLAQQPKGRQDDRGTGEALAAVGRKRPGDDDAALAGSESSDGPMGSTATRFAATGDPNFAGAPIWPPIRCRGLLLVVCALWEPNCSYLN